MRGNHEVGSFFEASKPCDYKGRPGRIPWEQHGPAVYLETGRQALRSIVEDLCGKGVHTVYLPGFLCDSMLDPFRESPLDIVFFSMKPNLQIDPIDLARLAQSSERWGYAVMIARYFGHARDSTYMTEIKRLREMGVQVVEDLTHTIFDETKSEANYTFASLRKLLPLATGAFVTGVESFHDQSTKVPARSIHEEIWQCMDDKRLFIDGEADRGNFYDRYMVANEALERVIAPRAMDARSMLLLSNLPYSEFARKRERNYAILSEAVASIADIRVVNDIDMMTPTHLVVAEVRPKNLRQALARRGIYCPVHWPRPRMLPDRLSWPSGHFSIPIDQRYDSDDMKYIATTLEELCR